MVRKMDEMFKMNRFSAKTPPEEIEKNEGYCVKAISLIFFSEVIEGLFTLYQAIPSYYRLQKLGVLVTNMINQYWIKLMIEVELVVGNKEPVLPFVLKKEIIHLKAIIPSNLYLSIFSIV